MSKLADLLKVFFTAKKTITIPEANDSYVMGSNQASHLTVDAHPNQERDAEIDSACHGRIRRETDSAETLCDQGDVLFGEGQLSEAEASYCEAIQLKPDLVNAHCNLGTVLYSQRRFSEAEASCREAIRLKPDLYVAHSNLGNILHDQERFTEAEASCREAIRLKLDFAQAHNNLGNTMLSQGRFAEAEASCREAIRLEPDFAQAHNNLGNTMHSQGRFAEAEASCREAIRLKPDFAEAHCTLGNALKDQGQLAEAEVSYRDAIRLNPDYAKAHCNLGNALLDQGRLAEAEASCRDAIRLNPDLEAAHSNLGTILQDQGRLAEAGVSYREAIRLNSDFAVARSSLLFSMNYIEDFAPSALLEEAKSFGTMVSRKADPKYDAWLAAPNPTKLRIGFVSGDFRNHPVIYFLEGLLKNIDKSRFELFAYTTTPEEDALTQRIKPLFNKWSTLFGEQDSDAAKSIYHDGLHILIDLAGHTGDNRLPVFSYKAAPVQVSWLGYFATTGVPEIDYLIADPWTLPASEEQYFTEKIWRLPNTRLCFTPPSLSLDISSLPALTNGYITFGCFSNLTKLNDSVVRLWARVLSAVPDSRLLIKAWQLNDSAIRQSILERFAAQGIDSGRLTLEKRVSRDEYLASYRKIDIVLDTFPFTGGTTTAEALWMGVPVLTLAGKRFIARQGMGLLMNAGLPEWIATDSDHFVKLAVSHTSDLQYLEKLRSGLRERIQNSPVFDAQDFALHFQTALCEMWHHWQKQHKKFT